MANIFIIFVCVYKECAIMWEKIGKSVRLFFFGFFFCEIDEISFLHNSKISRVAIGGCSNFTFLLCTRGKRAARGAVQV
jgi:hypothetical protein